MCLSLYQCVLEWIMYLDFIASWLTKLRGKTLYLWPMACVSTKHCFHSRQHTRERLYSVLHTSQLIGCSCGEREDIIWTLVTIWRHELLRYIIQKVEGLLGPYGLPLIPLLLPMPLSPQKILILRVIKPLWHRKMG